LAGREENLGREREIKKRKERHQLKKKKKRMGREGEDT
jgi:hypothetical protein